ncbi:MAG: hypothetical protein PHV34_23935 [Verrucomicrobiae bacterium]|nr:hypothetical protein [Verrucomicrobiae bacterium]
MAEWMPDFNHRIENEFFKRMAPSTNIPQSGNDRSLIEVYLNEEICKEMSSEAAVPNPPLSKASGDRGEP